ncbi:hypothetical protein B4U80_02584 [Leptotrombidium deliense]|uniref:Protein FAM136A n=1 Tax=Leptotrombidium deliense TaxID=299467 RepID=A0A443S468_9ACAR|nr:hypothetical protein B4U80_02584 [Leptotrombidium deliense]
MALQNSQNKLHDSIQKLVEDLDKDGMRKMQGDMHRCSAACCDSTTASVNETHACIEKCTEMMTRAQNYVQSELHRYQGRVERCVMECQDKVKDKITADSSQDQVNLLRNQFENCTVQCIDTNIALIPEMFKKMRDVIKKQSFVKAEF